MQHSRERRILRVVFIRILLRVTQGMIANQIRHKQTRDGMLRFIDVVTEFANPDAPHDEHRRQHQHEHKQNRSTARPRAIGTAQRNL